MCEHIKNFKLPCYHETCKKCFFKKLKDEGVFECEKCEFNTSQLKKYVELENSSACYINGRLIQITKCKLENLYINIQQSINLFTIAIKCNCIDNDIYYYIGINYFILHCILNYDYKNDIFKTAFSTIDIYKEFYGIEYIFRCMEKHELKKLKSTIKNENYIDNIINYLIKVSDEELMIYSNICIGITYINNNNKLALEYLLKYLDSPLGNYKTNLHIKLYVMKIYCNGGHGIKQDHECVLKYKPIIDKYYEEYPIELCELINNFLSVLFKIYNKQSTQDKYRNIIDFIEYAVVINSNISHMDSDELMYKTAKNNCIDLIEIIKNNISNKIENKLYYDLGCVYNYIGNPYEEDALKYYNLYLNSENLTEDIKSTIDYRKKNLYYAMAESFGLKKEYEKMIEYYKMGKHYSTLAYIYYEGYLGIKKDLIEAYKYYELSDNIYMRGKIQFDIKNYTKAVEILITLNDKDNYYSTKVQELLGDIYLLGGYGIIKDYAESINYYKKAYSDKSNKSLKKKIYDLYIKIGNPEKASEYK